MFHPFLLVGSHERPYHYCLTLNVTILALFDCQNQSFPFLHLFFLEMKENEKYMSRLNSQLLSRLSKDKLFP